MKIKRKAYISLEVVFLLTIMVISGMYVTIKLFNKGHNVSGQEAEAFSKVNHTVNNAINVGSSGGGGSGGGGGGSTPSEPTGVSEMIYWGIDASGKLIISDLQVVGAVESGSFSGDTEFTEDADDNPTTPWYPHADSIYSIEVVENNRKVAPASTAVWFEYLSNVSNIDVTDLDTSNVTDMYSMFYECGYDVSSFTITGLDTWDTSNVIYMTCMFEDAGYNSTTFNIGNIGNWDTSNVTNMGAMFYNAGYSATTWVIGDISGWKTSNVTLMTWMFSYAGRNAITELDLSGWDASNVTDMNHMFYKIESLQTVKTPKNIPSAVIATKITSADLWDISDSNTMYAAGTFPTGNGDVSHTLATSPMATNPYADKVASVQKLYDVGEAALTSADVIKVNGIDCYVLQADFSRGKAKLITKDIYNVRFDEGGHTSAEVEGHIGMANGTTDRTYDYKYSTLRTWMNDFYVNKLGSDPHILPTTVTYYTNSSSSSSLDISTTYTKGTVTDHVFALDGVEAQTNASKFSWDNSNKLINDDGSPSSNASFGFWSTAGHGNGTYSVYASNLSVGNEGSFYSTGVEYSKNGARPTFWITLR